MALGLAGKGREKWFFTYKPCDSVTTASTPVMTQQGTKARARAKQQVEGTDMWPLRMG